MLSNQHQTDIIETAHMGYSKLDAVDFSVWKFRDKLRALQKKKKMNTPLSIVSISPSSSKLEKEVYFGG